MGKYYGIDLGTTNSLIGNYEEDFLSDLTPSCVDMDSGNAGKEEYLNAKAQRGFKVNMSMGNEGAAPRVASTCVLRELVRLTNGKAKDVVISVPAYFSDNQRSATKLAAQNAGLNVVGLVNEPTAAAIYIARNKRSLFLVMDLGGGTFDVSIIDSRFGQYQVQATDGLIKGGNDLDRNIERFLVTQAKIKLYNFDEEEETLLRLACTDFKIQMTTHYGEDQYIDLSRWGGPSKFLFTVEDYKKLVHKTFKDTIDKTKALVEKYITENNPYEILLVGGSTKCPYYRDWVAEELGQEPEPLTYDPDRVVALGAAYYAHLLESGEIDNTVADVTKQLSIGLADGSCKILVYENSAIPLSSEEVLMNSTDASKLQLDLFQGNSTFWKDNELIGTLIWDYGEKKKAGEGIVYVTIEIQTDGTINLSCREPIGEVKTIVIDRSSLDK